MEEKITFQEIELNKYQMIFHEIHEIRRELQNLRIRLINIGEAIDDMREIADREMSLHPSTSPTSSPHPERNGIFTHRLKLASVVRLQFKHLSNTTIQMANQTTTLQEICSWLADLVFQTLSQKMNQTMKTLTLISMIFIPLTFIVGVYGTNFEYLPELRWKYGYVFLWAICAVVVIVELFVFRRLRWL
jgi:Mg2+ and Co2+ transporter CorA